MCYGTSAHGARLKRYPQIKPVQPALPEGGHRCLNRQYFSVMQRIAILTHPVARQRDDRPPGIGYGSGHRHLAAACCCRCLVKKAGHYIGLCA
jgi:hypothetical protein